MSDYAADLGVGIDFAGVRKKIRGNTRGSGPTDSLTESDMIIYLLPAIRINADHTSSFVIYKILQTGKVSYR